METKNSPRYTGPELEIEGDKTIRFNRRQPINRGRALLNAGYYWRVKHDYYKRFLEQFKDATTVKENDNITQSLVEHQIPFEKFAKSLGNALWKPVDWSEISVTFEKHEGHARSDWTNIPQSKLRMMPDTQKRVEGYKSDQFDLGVSAQDPISNIMDQIPDMKMIREFPYFYYRNVRFNFRDEFHTSRRGVRRAFAYMLNQKGLRRSQMSANGYKTFPVLQNGMAIGVSRTFLGREFNDKLIDYGFEPKPDKAAAELEREGYSKQKDRWISPNGKPLKISVMSGPEPREKVSVQYIASQLSRNGITVEPQFVSGTNQWIAIAEQYQNIPGAMRQFGGGPHPSIPYVNWWAQVVELPGQVAEQPPLRPVEECGGGGEVETPTLKLDRTPRWKRPVRPEYPVEVGDPADPEDTESQTLMPIKWDREIERTQSLERVKELARKLAWYQNWQVTDVQYYTESWSQAGDTVNFFWGDGSFNEDWIREPYSLWVQGLVQGRTKPYNGKPEGPIKPGAKSRAKWRGPENGG